MTTTTMTATPAPTPEEVEARTLRWLRDAVIGLNLCPFAKAVDAKGQLRIAVSDATDEATLRVALHDELRLLAAADPQRIDTTLLVHPQALADDFDAFNQFLDEADDELCAQQLEGEIQIASFHPHYRFAGTQADDITNATNRAPFPMLHLLREASVERAVAAFPDADAIVDANLATLRRLGRAGWARLAAGWAGDRR